MSGRSSSLRDIGGATAGSRDITGVNQQGLEERVRVCCTVAHGRGKTEEPQQGYYSVDHHGRVSGVGDLLVQEVAAGRDWPEHGYVAPVSDALSIAAHFLP